MDLASKLGKNSSGITEKDGSEPVFVWFWDQTAMKMKFIAWQSLKEWFQVNLLKNVYKKQEDVYGFSLSTWKNCSGISEKQCLNHCIQ